MLNKYLKSRITDAKRIVKELKKEYDYVSVLGSVVSTKQITVSTHINSIDEVDSECGFVIKLYKDGRYSEYSCNDIKELKAKDVIKAVKLNKVVSDDFKVKMLEEETLVKDYLREDKSSLSDKEIDEEDFMEMKDGAILTNAGHFDCEVDMAGLRAMAVESKLMRNNIMGYKLPTGQWICVIAEGRLVNLAAGDGHPAEIMDMSFAIQALSAKYLVEHQGQMDSMLVDVPKDVDMDVASRKLEFLGKKIDKLTEEQIAYLNASL